MQTIVQRTMSRRWAMALLASSMVASSASVQAQAVTPPAALSAKPISLIVPWPPGGSTDRHFRALSEIAGRHLGQTINVENKPGAGGTLGPGGMALNAKPDGYTIAQFPLGMLRYPHMQKTAWHPINDFTFIIGITGYTFGFVVKADSPFKSFQDYVAAARKDPGKVDYGSTGIGTSPHLLIEELSDAAKINLNHVPYKGNADLMQAVLGGHVMAGSDASGWDKLVDGGQMRLLLTFGEQRSPRWPSVPTAKELGFDLVSTSPYGLVGPKGMDPEVVRTLHDAFKKAIDDPKHMELLTQLNQPLWYRNSADYKAWAQSTFTKEKALIDRLGLGAK